MEWSERRAPAQACPPRLRCRFQSNGYQRWTHVRAASVTLPVPDEKRAHPGPRSRKKPQQSPRIHLAATHSINFINVHEPTQQQH